MDGTDMKVGLADSVYLVSMYHYLDDVGRIGHGGRCVFGGLSQGETGWKGAVTCLASYIAQ